MIQFIQPDIKCLESTCNNNPSEQIIDNLVNVYKYSLTTEMLENICKNTNIYDIIKYIINSNYILNDACVDGIIGLQMSYEYYEIIEFLLTKNFIFTTDHIDVIVNKNDYNTYNSDIIMKILKTNNLKLTKDQLLKIASFPASELTITQLKFFINNTEF